MSVKISFYANLFRYPYFNLLIGIQNALALRLTSGRGATSELSNHTLSPFRSLSYYLSHVNTLRTFDVNR